MEIIYQLHLDADGEPLAVPVIPFSATVDETEAILAAEGAAVMPDDQATERSAYLAEGLNPAGVKR